MFSVVGFASRETLKMKPETPDHSASRFTFDERPIVLVSPIGWYRRSGHELCYGLTAIGERRALNLAKMGARISCASGEVSDSCRFISFSSVIDSKLTKASPAR